MRTELAKTITFSQRRANSPSKGKPNQYVLPTLVKTSVLADKHCLSLQILLLQKFYFHPLKNLPLESIHKKNAAIQQTQQMHNFNIQSYHKIH